jgi:A/G-specific adenine glycosylase
VLTRVFGISENPRDKKANAILWTLAEELVALAAPKRSEGGCSHLNQSLMELGALICIPREPKCLLCPIAKHCFAFQNNRVNEFPNLEKRPTSTARRFAAFVVQHEGKFLVRQRPEGVVNAHLWEFPNVELNGEPVNPTAAVKELFGFTPKEVESLCMIKHSITRYRITVEAFRVGAPSNDSARKINANNLPSGCSGFRERWLTMSALQKLSFPSAHGKILKAILHGRL